MDIETLKGLLNTFTSNPIFSIYALVKTDKSFSLKNIKIENNSLPTLRDAYVNKIHELTAEEDLSLLDVTSSDDRKNAIYKYDLQESLEIFNIITNGFETVENQNNSDAEDVDIFSNNRENFDLSELSKLIGFVARFQYSRGKYLTLFGRYNPVAYLSASKIVLFWSDTSQLAHLNKDIIQFYGNFDFFQLADGDWYITKLATLEKFFGFHEKIKQVAALGVRKIEEASIVSSTEKLKVLIDKKLPIARKVAKICKDSIVLGLKAEEILNYINSNQRFSRELKKDKNNKIILKTEKQVKLFLKLLDDGILRSDLTNQEYDVKAKDLLPNDSFDVGN